MPKLAKRSSVAIFLLITALSSDGFVLNFRQTYIVTPSSNNNVVLYSSAIDQTQNNSDSVDATSTSSNNNQSPAPLATTDDWSAYLDESKGLLYYFNRRTGKSQWEPPADVVFPEIAMSIDKKVEMRARLKSYLKDRLDDSSKDTNIIDSMEKDRKRIEKKRKEATEKLNAKMSKLQAIKKQQKQRQQVTTINNNIAASSSSTTRTPMQPIDSKEQQQSKEIDDTKPTSLPIVQQREWSAYFDIKSGLVFYYNEDTKVSLWDPPSQDFPRVVMENNIPIVLDPRTSNISMERALTMTMEEDEAQEKWKEAKEKEKARKVKLRAEKKAAAEATAATAVESANEEKIATQKRELSAEQKRRSEEALELNVEEKAKEMADVAAAATAQIAAEQQRIESERIDREKEAAAASEQKKQQLQQQEEEARSIVRTKYEAAKAAELRRLEQERIDGERKLAEAQVLLDKERLEKERAAAVAAKKKKEEDDKKAASELVATSQVTTTADTTAKQPVRPKEEPAFTVDNVENMVAPLTTDTTVTTLYDILQCPPTATRPELKRAYIALAKETHPDALLQAGVQTNEIVPDKFVEISQAWKILGDSTSRRRYDREIRAKGVSTAAGSIFENWVMGAAKKMDEALSKAEDGLESKQKQ